MSQCMRDWSGSPQAEKEADVIIWDGGNNDTPFFKPGVLTHPQHMACERPTMQRQLRHSNMVATNQQILCCPCCVLQPSTAKARACDSPC